MPSSPSSAKRCRHTGQRQSFSTAGRAAPEPLRPPRLLIANNRSPFSSHSLLGETRARQQQPSVEHESAGEPDRMTQTPSSKVVGVANTALINENAQLRLHIEKYVRQPFWSKRPKPSQFRPKTRLRFPFLNRAQPRSLQGAAKAYN